MKTALTTLGISLLVLAGCTGQKQPANDFIQENIDNAVAQEMLQTDIIEKSGKIRRVAFIMFPLMTGAPASFPVIFGIHTS